MYIVHTIKTKFRYISKYIKKDSGKGYKYPGQL